jgi:hypothetical protein
MAPRQEHLTMPIRAALEEAADLRCYNCPATLATDTEREALGWASCRYLYVHNSRDDAEQGCRKGPVSSRTMIFGAE